MTSNSKIQKSLTDQILEELLKTVTTCAEFDDHTMKELTGLAACGDLKKPAQVAAAIKSSSGTKK